MPSRSWTTLIAALCCTPIVAGCLRVALDRPHGPNPHGLAPSDAQAAPRSAAELRQVGPAIVQRTNAIRGQQGRSPLRVEDTLTATAQDFADFMARTDRLAHDADGNSPGGRATAHGYDYCEIFENIADEASTLPPTTDEIAAQFVTGWMGSTSHRQNMLEPDVTEIGVGVARNPSSGAYVAVELLGRPRSMQITFSVANQTDGAIEYTVGSDPYTVPPRAVQTHRVCRPAALTLRGAAASGGQRQPFVPRDGERVSIVRTADGSIDVHVSR